MARKSFTIATLAIVLSVLGFGPGIPREAGAAECAASETIDGSTAEMARKKMEQAGFQQIRDLTKGCDNFWHGKATKDGVAVNIVLSPQGQVKTEGD